MATTLDTFLPYVTTYAPECPEPTALQALRFSAIDFCNQSDLIQRMSTPDVVAGQQAYDLTPFIPVDMNLCRVVGVGWLGRWLAATTPDAARSGVALRGVPIGTDQPLVGVPASYFQANPTSNIILLYPIPSDTYTAGLTIRTSHAPTQTAATVEDVLYSDWGEDIASGALARILAMPDQPYTNPRLAAAFKAAFGSAINEARRTKEMGKTAGSQRVASRPFA